MSLRTGTLGAFSARLATVNFLRAGKDINGDNAHLAISGSADIFVSASTTYFTGDLKTKTGTFSSTADAPSLTLSTALGHLYLNPADKVYAQKEITSSHGKFSTSGVSMTLMSGAGDIAFSPASGSKVTLDAPLKTSSGLFESSVAATHTTDAGDLTMSPAGDFVVTRPFKTSNGTIASTASSGLALSTSAGPLALQPASGADLTTTAKFVTSDGRFDSTVAATFTTQAGDLTLHPAGDIVMAADLEVATGLIHAPNSLTLATDNGDLSLSPSAGSDIMANAKIVSSDGRFESQVASTLSTITGNMTLDPFGSLILNKDTTLTTGKLSSGGTNDLVLESGSGKVVINGDLDIQGTINSIETAFIKVEDKTINLSSSASSSDSNADGSGLVIEGSAYAATPGSNDLSLIWNHNSGSTPYWQLSGGDLFVTRKITSGAVVTYEFCIDDSEELIIKKKVDSGASASVAIFNA